MCAHKQVSVVTYISPYQYGVNLLSWDLWSQLLPTLHSTVILDHAGTQTDTRSHTQTHYYDTMYTFAKVHTAEIFECAFVWGETIEAVKLAGDWTFIFSILFFCRGKRAQWGTQKMCNTIHTESSQLYIQTIEYIQTQVALKTFWETVWSFKMYKTCLDKRHVLYIVGRLHCWSYTVEAFGVAPH